MTDLTKEALQHIENKTLAIHDGLNKHNSDFPTMVLPKDMEIHSLESSMKLRNQFRARMITKSTEDFVAYFEKNDGKNCFINAEGMSANSIFDLGTIEKPLHCKHEATLTLQKTAAFNELQGVNTKQMSQREMADWVEEWHDLLLPLSNEKDPEEEGDYKSISLSKAVNAIRKMTIEEIVKSDHQQESFKGSRTTMESIEAKAEDGMPGYFEFVCVPYEGLEEKTFRLRLNILKSHDNPVFVMRVQRFDSIAEDLAKEFQKLLSGKLPKECETYIGELAV